MALAKMNDTVRVHYTGTLKDGTVFDSSMEREPLEFTIGEGMVIASFEKAIIGMGVGETKDISVSPEEAYGEYREDMIISFDRKNIPPNIKPEPGMILQLHDPHGGVTFVKVLDMDENIVRLDANHPLAGKELFFKVQLMEIL
ncbi:MAG TPA: peptidylprolyl isomerase [Syntrophorhabdaceae bacterium]|nr:peptidylprolyl isomerase [Syntrophorhabdaceae bacterium]HOT43069.1 peptidylprolyl isomerase [Syntrophorhabdaceae bacterium]HQE80089.1 peptidylprolyl isomerase [Syntrophorhabdaceae bacterium]HQH43738.1 peptidylprolyl isomerase [Syntrophorhabdaceae bacterium]HQK46830.1 peptidylprolyl isomerase [Syntrophorhabdaceae bacterium]